MVGLPLHVVVSVLLLFCGNGVIKAAASRGIKYGCSGNDLPPPDKFISLLCSLSLSQVRIYNTNPTILSAFANTDINLIVTVENKMISTLTKPHQALQWVATHIRPFFPATKITGIAVGSEIFTSDTSLAMKSIHAALVKLRLYPYIHVLSPISFADMAASYPPSSGCFKPELAGDMPKFPNLPESSKSPIWITAYPYFAYKHNPKLTPPLDDEVVVEGGARGDRGNVGEGDAVEAEFVDGCACFCLCF